MIKRFLSFITAVCLCFAAVSISGCSFWKIDETPVNKVKPTAPKVDDEDYKDLTAEYEGQSEYYDPIDITVGYDNLETDEQRTCYQLLDDCVDSISEEEKDGVYCCKLLTMDYVILTETEMRLVIAAYKIDHPLVFWLTENFGYSNTNGYTALQMYSYEQPQSLANKQKKLYGKINKFLESVPKGLDEFNREIKAHDHIIKRSKYADNVSSAKDDYLAFTIYGALVNGSAVCEGYAKCMEYFLARLGIESYTVVGMGSKELHMWNAVKIDNKWYYVDPSWDDGKDYAQYDYFNISTDYLLKDHSLSKTFNEYSEEELNGDGNGTATNFNITVPICDSMENNYYVRTAPHFTDLYSYYDENIIDSLFRTACRGGAYFHIYIDPLYLDYNTAVEQLFNSGDQLFFGYIDSVNAMNPSYYIDRNNVYIIKKENLNVVTAKINY